MPFERHAVEAAPAEPDAKPLAVKHAHARDARIAFRDHDHAYFVYDPESDTYLRVTRSVSGIHARYSTPFEAYETALKVVKKRKHDKSSPYYWFLQAQPDLDDDEGAARAVCDAWNQNGARSSGLGTKCHAALEDHLNGLPIEAWMKDAKCAPLVRAGKRWIEEKVDLDDWRPWRTEYSIFIDGHSADCEEDRPALEAHAALVAGQVDAIFIDKNGRHHMVDWKFCGKDKLDKNSGEFRGKVPMCKAPVDHVPDNSYGHYLLQQSLYAYMLKKRYGIELASMRLLHIPTDVGEEVEPIEIPLEPIDDEIICALYKNV